MNNPTSCQYIPTDVQKQGLPLIHGEDISASFGTVTLTKAVNHINFSIIENKITAIIGESGSGKSTLLKLIYGLLEPSSGEVRYRGWLVPTRKDKLIPGHDAMKLVSQGFDDLNQYAKVWDNVASQISNKDLTLKKTKTIQVLEKLHIDHLAQQRVADLSGGERQRVAIARALINEPEVLLMDEPFNQVDAAFRDALQQDIRKIVAESGLTVILVSHDPAEVLAMSDELIVMKDGHIVDAGTPDQLYYAPQNPYTALLLAKSNILSPNEAQSLGISSQRPIGIHQEWIEVRPNENSFFEITEVRFRGFYNEYVIVNEDIKLYAIARSGESLLKGSRVNVLINRYISFEGIV